MAEVSSSLEIASGTLTRVVVADRGGARRRSFASSIGPAVVSAGVAVMGSRGGSGCNADSTLMANKLAEVGNSVTNVNRRCRVASRALATVVVASAGSARRLSFASSIGPAVVGARVAVVDSRGGSGRYGGSALVANKLAEIGNRVAYVHFSFQIASWALAHVVITSAGRARCRSYTIGGSPAVVSAGIAVVGSRGGSRGDGGGALVL
jgi:hypothetical protein